MNTFKKNQIIITALAIMIAIAGYLNFTNKADDLGKDQVVFNSSAKDTVDISIDQSGVDATGLVPNDDLLNVNVIEELSEETAITTTDTVNETITDQVAEDVVVEDLDLVAADADTAQGVDANEDVVGEAVFVSSNSVETGYFLKAKIEREQVRALSVETLMALIGEENVAEEQKVDAAAQLIQLQDIMEKEAAAESLLEAKGYEDVFVRMNKTNVDVVVNLEQLTETDLAQISDVTSRKTGIDPSEIVISLLKTKS